MCIRDSLRYMLPKRLQSEMVTQWVYGLYTSGICYPRGYKLKWQQWVHGLYTSGICYPRGYKVKWQQWVHGLYTSGICYSRGYEVKWWHSEIMVCIPQVYATQEVTKWSVTISLCNLLGSIYLRYTNHKLTVQSFHFLTSWVAYTWGIQTITSLCHHFSL